MKREKREAYREGKWRAREREKKKEGGIKEKGVRKWHNVEMWGERRNGEKKGKGEIERSTKGEELTTRMPQKKLRTFSSEKWMPKCIKQFLCMFTGHVPLTVMWIMTVATRRQRCKERVLIIALQSLFGRSFIQCFTYCVFYLDTRDRGLFPPHPLQQSWLIYFCRDHKGFPNLVTALLMDQVTTCTVDDHSGTNPRMIII